MRKGGFPLKNHLRSLRIGTPVVGLILDNGATQYSGRSGAHVDATHVLFRHWITEIYDTRTSCCTDSLACPVDYTARLGEKFGFWLQLQFKLEFFQQVVLVIRQHIEFQPIQRFWLVKFIKFIQRFPLIPVI